MAAGIVSSLRSPTSVEVASDDGPVVGVRLRVAAVPLGLTDGGETEATPEAFESEA